jgi:16S rRNA (adenine1518-N6/adenine1519-N6)-dimethyltransferase
VTMLLTDALEGKNRLSGPMLEAVTAQLDAAPQRHFKLVANLPYHIATPLITNLLALDRPPERMTITIQKEVADRLLAQPGSKDFGSLSLWVQAQCRVELVRVLPPSVFWPQPKVSSAIVDIRLDEQLRARLPDREGFHRFVRSMFLHRRKLLRSELLAATEGRLTKPQIDDLIRRLGLGALARAEELDVTQMIALSAAVRAET